MFHRRATRLELKAKNTAFIVVISVSAVDDSKVNETKRIKCRFSVTKPPPLTLFDCFNGGRAGHERLQSAKAATGRSRPYHCNHFVFAWHFVVIHAFMSG